MQSNMAAESSIQEGEVSRLPAGLGEGHTNKLFHIRNTGGDIGGARRASGRCSQAWLQNNQYRGGGSHIHGGSNLQIDRSIERYKHMYILNPRFTPRTRRARASPGQKRNRSHIRVNATGQDRISRYTHISIYLSIYLSI